MRIVVTTPTGNIGSVVTEQLLNAGQSPVLIVRDAAKVKAATDRGAVAIEGSHADADFLTEATQGADALFVLTPNDYQVQDIRAYYTKFATAAAIAVRKNAIPHVVHLSSVGAELQNGNGPVRGLYEAEQILNAAGIKNLTHLRPGYFMENTLGQAPNVLQARQLFTTFPTGTRFPMIATRDIGIRAADLLLNRDWTGHQVVELLGQETGYDDVAEALSKALNRRITHVTVTDEQMIDALTGMGISKVMAESLAELCEGITQGRVINHAPRTEENTATTTYQTFADEVFVPVLKTAEATG